MSDALTTQMLTPSLRRVYRSRAWCSAISASAACRLPTCTWLSPRLPRRNTSKSGQLWSVTGGLLSRRLSFGLIVLRFLNLIIPNDWSLNALGLRRVCQRGLTDPGAFFVGGLAPGDALGVARAVAGDDGLELVPVDRAEVVVAARLVPAQVGVGERDAELLRLRDGHVDEALAPLVVGVALCAPAHRLVGVRRVTVGRAEHHQRRPPGAVDRVLDHVALGLGTAHHRHEQLVTLSLVERLFLADADHRAGVGAVGGAAQRHLVADRGPVD